MKKGNDILSAHLLGPSQYEERLAILLFIEKRLINLYTRIKLNL